MKKNILLIIVALATILLVGADLAMALQPVPKESGFGGFFRPGVGYLRYKTNLVASFVGYDLSEKSINSRFNTPDSESSAFALLPFSLHYTFADTRTQVLVGTELTDLVRFDYTQQIAVKQELGEFGILQAGFLFSAVPAKVWKDPYLVNQERSKTNRRSMGFRLAWDRILQTDLQLQYTYRNIDVSSEQSGQSVAGLTPGQRELLKRDGGTHQLEALYRFTLAEQHRLMPAIVFTLDDRDGGAMKSNAYDFQVTYAYNGDPITAFVTTFVGWADYDKENPIYLKKQEDDRFGLNGQVYYKNPWGWTLLGSDPMRFYISVAYMNIDSNINFYDQEGFLTTVGVGWTW